MASTFLTIVVVFLAFSLIGIIMMQRSKAGGGLGAVAGGASESFFGADAGNVLAKYTKILLIAFLIATLLLAYANANRTADSIMSGVEGPKAKVEEKAAKPAETPAAKPAPKAEEKPAAKPAPKAEEKPADKK